MTSAIPSDCVCSDSHLVPDLGLNRLPSKHLNPGRACIPRTGVSCLQTYLHAPVVLLSVPPISTPTGDLFNFGPDSRCPTLHWPPSPVNACKSSMKNSSKKSRGVVKSADSI
ncbi:unnamed protein product [Staurois parvus]|uniref:Uncharacterized protein n=1 Tax=Staurois parvus TaxID=386267 RepID=A0ABN9ADT7_9NEOB|nr:unnamed protein product [Staurois parvus]